MEQPLTKLEIGLGPADWDNIKTLGHLINDDSSNLFFHLL